MSPYKAFLNNTRQYFNTNGFLRFLLSIYIVVFAVGGGFFVLGSFLYGFFGEFLICIGIILMLAGLLLTLIKEDMMVLVIVSGSIALGSLVAWIVRLATFGGYGGLYGIAAGYLGFDPFNFTAFFYFLAFGAIALIVFLKAEKFKQMRAASAARAQMAGIGCPRCGAFIPMNAAFCPSCGAQNPAMQQYAVPAQPQYAPPAPPVQPQYAPPVQPQYAPPVQPQYTPQAQPQYAPPAPPAEPEASAVAKCVSCGAFIPAGVAFCSKCGAKQ